MAQKPTFGVFVPQGWKMELSSIDGAEAKWARAVEIALLAEELGYDSLWVYDHFHNVPRPAHEAVFECWMTIAAISQRTSRVRLGQMVGCNSYRNPATLAKMTSTVDVMSGGRLDWGIGAGWYEHEYKAYGYEFPAAKVRIGMLREASRSCGPCGRKRTRRTKVAITPSPAPSATPSRCNNPTRRS